MIRTIPLVLLLLAFLPVACGGGAEDDPTPVPTPSDVDDEAYLAIICEGLDAFSDAVDTSTTVEQLAASIQTFIDELQAVAPPADVAEFHTAFTNYLIQSLDDPTRPLVAPPPLPSDDIRERLADKERNVTACKNPTFFAADE